MKNAMPIATDNPESCDTHGAPAKKDYDFGKYADATVTTYRCGCAAVFFNTGFNDPGALYPDYASAAGRARLAVALATSRDIR